MNIGMAASRSGVSAKMIRYYERSGLIPPAARLASGYREYGETDVHRLRFVRRARDLGFSVEQIGELLSLWGDRGRASADVHAVTLAHIRQLQDKAAEIQGMIAVLQQLADSCHHDDSPECPILEDLAGAAGPAAAQRPASARFGYPGERRARACASQRHD
ncbi:MAG TPA: Cu(I)-responsive transcriptional regulator [Xanthomonadaceae bacterium]|nr:Cu(I)-responsive transcriptional regulator [Xanthomonadaceae bacterium]